MSDALQFERIVIRRMPGFDWDTGFEVAGLGPGVNILYGPNGSGKSTTATAIEYLLWPEIARGAGAYLAAQIRCGDESIDASLEGPLGARYEPRMPDACANDRRTRYQFPLDQLLVDTGSRFAEDLASQMSGGYSIHMALRAAEKAIPIGAATSLRKALDERRDEYRRADERQAGIAAAERELPMLATRLEAVLEAKRNCSAITLALEYRDSVQAWLNSLRSLHSLDRKAGNARESDLRTAAASKALVGTARVEFWTAYGEVSRHTPSGRWERLPDGFPTGLHETLASHCTSLRALEAAIEQKRGAVARAEQAFEATLRELSKYPGAKVGAKAETLLGADIVELQRLALDEEAARALSTQFGRLREVLGVSGEPASSEQCERRATESVQACARLAEWLREGSGISKEESARRSNLALGLLGLAFGGALVGLALPIVGVLVSLMALVAFLVVGRASVQESGIRSRIEATFPSNGIPGPTTWDPAQVQSRMDALLLEAGKERERQVRLARWESLRSDAEQAENEWRRLDRERLDAVVAYGLTFGTGAQSLAHLVGALGRSLTAQAALAGAQGELEQALKDRESRLTEIGSSLSGFGFARPDGLAEAERLCTRLRDWERADRVWEAAQARLKAARKERRRFYQSLELRIGDDTTLERWVGEAKLYSEAVVAAKSKHEAARSRRSAVQPDLRRLPVAELRVRLDAAQALADQEQDIRGEIRDRTIASAEARRGNDLGLALEAVHAAEMALVDHRQARKAQRIRQLVGESVARELRATTMPEVFQEARRLFQQVTNGEYSLTFDPDKNSFGAELRGRPLSLDALSKGTRVQALLAVRLAWLVCQEAGARLPVMFDETLANCDEERANAIMDTVSELCADRQVFYFTAQADEVLRWKERLGDDRVHVVDMAEVRRTAGRRLPAQRRVRYVDTIRTAITGPLAPGELDHEAYGRALDVVPIDPTQPTESLHVWHLVSEPALAYELSAKGLSHWGALREACQLAAPAPLGDADLRLAMARAAGIEEACRCWMSDKASARIDPEQLGGWLGRRTVRDDVLRRAAACDWEGDALVRSLRAERIASFGATKIDDLYAWLIEHGFAAAGDSVPYEDAFIRVQTAMGRYGPSGLDRSEVVAILARVGYAAKVV